MKLRIKELREAKGLSQLSLAERIDVNQTAVSQWERGINDPQLEKLPLIARALECTISDLFPPPS